MRPVEQIAPEACRQLRGVAFDIDDTLTLHGRLQHEAFLALWRLHAAGLRLVAVTGRPLGWADVVARQWPVDAAVGENGAGWAFVREGRLHEGYRSDDRQRREQKAQLDRVVAAVRAQWPALTYADDQGARRCDVAFDVGEAGALDAEQREQLARSIRALGARCLVSSVHAHVIVGDWNKANGVVGAVHDACAIDVASERDAWLFVGDSGNDADAFAFFPVSAGVANVERHLASLPVPPRFVARQANGLGFAEIADVILRHRG